MFDPARKQPIPAYPDTIGVVTSPTGAVIHDICQVALRRDPQARILLCPVRVQGVGAADEVAHAIALLDRIDSVSVIIVARGGGSIEDLWTFHEEQVVRAVAACRKPVVSAVGHEPDVTLCDMAADLRAPTPSAAAECVVPIRSETQARLDAARAALDDGALRQIGRCRSELLVLAARLQAQRLASRLVREAQRLDVLRAALDGGIQRRMERARWRLGQCRRELDMLSPYSVLSRGYAIVLRDGVPVKSAALLADGDRLTLRFADGEAAATVAGSAAGKEKR